MDFGLEEVGGSVGVVTWGPMDTKVGVTGHRQAPDLRSGRRPEVRGRRGVLRARCLCFVIRERTVNNVRAKNKLSVFKCTEGVDGKMGDLGSVERRGRTRTRVKEGRFGFQRLFLWKPVIDRWSTQNLSGVYYKKRFKIMSSRLK